jgi:hypothetical protein
MREEKKGVKSSSDELLYSLSRAEWEEGWSDGVT